MLLFNCTKNQQGENAIKVESTTEIIENKGLRVEQRDFSLPENCDESINWR
jgi:hypothetical protein